MSDSPAQPKADARRAELAERIADHLLSEGLSAASLRQLAQAAGLSDRMLIYYFGTRDEAIAAGLEIAAGRLAADLAAAMSPQPLRPEALIDHLAAFVLSDAQAPVMTLWLEIVAQAARREAPYAAMAPVIARSFLEWASAQLDVPPARRQVEALGVLAKLDGLVLLKAAGLDVTPAQRRSAS